MIRKFCLSLGLLALSNYPLAAEQLKGEISAQSAILINAETGRVLFEKNAQTTCFPASTTKVATALYALTKKGHDLDAVVTASSEAVGYVSPQVRKLKHPSYRLEHGGSHMSLKIGEQLTFRDLLYGLMLSSGNDAANVIAEHVSGNIPAFMGELNAFLKSCGCSKTTFYNPHGLPSDEHCTTAYDLARMAQAGLQIPTFREIVKSAKYIRPATNKQSESVLIQGNALVRPGTHYYPKAIGIKTGYTMSARQNLVAAAADGKRTLILVLLGCSDFHQRYRDAIALFETAFNEKPMSRTVFAKESDLFTTRVKGASKSLQAALVDDFKIEYFPSEEPEVQAVFHWHKLKLPIKQGDEVGEIELVDRASGKTMKRMPVHATETLVATFFYKVLCVMQAAKVMMSHKLAMLIMATSLFGAVIYLFNRKLIEKKQKLV